LSRLTTRELAVGALFTALLAVSAYISIPIGSVPFTLQVFVVLLAGLVLGPRIGLLSVLAYLVLGLVAPVYSGGASGLGALFGPTGGYLIGFIPAVLVTGVLAGRRDAGLPRLTAAGLAGLVPVYVLGTTWLAIQLDLSPIAAITTGVLPFVWIDVLKALAAALTARVLVNLPLGLPAESTRGR
jgi:biotin transport system substrate-specific component